MSFPDRVETERLVLRRWREEDRDAFTAIWREPQVWRALIPERPFDPEFAPDRFEHHLAHWDEHGFGLWASVHDGEVVGWVGAAHPSHAPDVAEAVEVGW